MTVALLRHIQDGDDRYDAILLWCPGCQYEQDGRFVGGLNALPVTGDEAKHPVWTWNGDLVNVGLEPSILTHSQRGGKEFICHSFLRNGQWQFLGDCTHNLAGQTVSMISLPPWVTG